jgi:hypothetical protein
MATKSTKQQETDQMDISYTNIFNFKTLQNLPKSGLLVSKYIIWQPWYVHKYEVKLQNPATLDAPSLRPVCPVCGKVCNQHWFCFVGPLVWKHLSQNLKEFGYVFTYKLHIFFWLNDNVTFVLTNSGNDCSKNVDFVCTRKYSIQ